jgi:streptomycin 6-kinase
VSGDGLGESQRSTRLLHGDLHRHNVLSDDARGSVAIDPKGVVGEPPEPFII